ncbi:hypothetical protein DMUE_1632 [Dictyocoela muelleri]|nr:hypothetical protein DMUE_1632 [Dictyocoela muelleri]
MLFYLIFADCSIYETINSLLYYTLGKGVTFYIFQATILVSCLYLGIIGSRKKVISSTILIFFLFIIADLNKILNTLKEWFSYFSLPDTILTKIELLISSDIVLTIISIAILSFLISYITVRILDVVIISIFGFHLFTIFKSTIEPVIIEIWAEPMSLFARIVLHLILFIIIYYICKMSIAFLYALFFSIVGSLGCFRTIENIFEKDLGYWEFFNTGNISSINHGAQIANVLLIGIFVGCQFFYKDNK